MKNLLLAFIFSLACSVCFGMGARDLTGENYSLRYYLQSVEGGMRGEAQYQSNSNMELSTATYSGTTSKIYVPVKIVDDSGLIQQWFSDSVSNFSVSQTIDSTVGQVVLDSSTINFNSGSAGITLTITGTWSIGDSATVSFPALSGGVLSAATSSQILTFTE